LLAIAAGIGCSQGNQEQTKKEMMEFTVLEQGNHSGVQMERFETIKDSAAFGSLWQAHKTGASPPPLCQHWISQKKW
jgi:ribose 1,5-bisphosphokinase PhnN